MNGELYGDPTTLPWGIIFPTVPDAPRHPLQLYEMILAVIVLVIAWQVARRRAFPGQVWWMIVVLTSIGRIFLDALRSEEHDILGIIAYGQIAAVILLVVGGWFLWRRPTWGALSLVVLPLSILAMGFGLFSNAEVREITPSLRSSILTTHHAAAAAATCFSE